MKILIDNQQKVLVLSKKHIEILVKKILEKEQIYTDEVHLYFVSKKKISSLHKKYFNDPSPTDCITLPLDPPNDKSPGRKILGEVFVCPEIALHYTKKHPLNVYDEVALYIIHGLLHLIGFGDISEKEKRIMRKKEKKCMEIMKREFLGICEKHKKDLLLKYHV